MNTSANAGKKEPERFTMNPYHHTLGLNSYAV